MYLATLLLTQLITNNAAAALMVPLTLAMAGELGMAVRPLLLAVVMAASASYATPMGYQMALASLRLGERPGTSASRHGQTPSMGASTASVTRAVTPCSGTPRRR